jgi:hypothetical protein
LEIILVEVDEFYAVLSDKLVVTKALETIQRRTRGRRLGNCDVLFAD